MTPRSTPRGEHRPVMLDAVLAALDPRPGAVVVDCTLGFAGHSEALLRRIGPTGRLIALDLDAANLEPARQRLEAVGGTFHLHAGNFAGLPGVLGVEGVTAVDAVLADLGVSSMQIDDPDRGFSFMRDGPLDMRMDPARGKTAAHWLATLPVEDLARAIAEFGDEPRADRIARAIVERRARQPLERTRELAELIAEAAPVTIEKPRPGVPTPRQQRLRPTARVFQALRILVNRELANLQHLVRVLPTILAPGGRAAIISFHSGEDRLVKQAFREGFRAGVYEAISPDAERAAPGERFDNPRSRSAKLRWARRGA